MIHFIRVLFSVVVFYSFGCLCAMEDQRDILESSRPLVSETVKLEEPDGAAFVPGHDQVSVGRQSSACRRFSYGVLGMAFFSFSWYFGSEVGKALGVGVTIFGVSML